MLNINQNFDLKAPVFNFDRDYFNSVEELNAYDTSNVPNHFVTNVAGMLYQFTNGKWWPILGTTRNGSTIFVGNKNTNLSFGDQDRSTDLGPGYIDIYGSDQSIQASLSIDRDTEEPTFSLYDDRYGMFKFNTTGFRISDGSVTNSKKISLSINDDAANANYGSTVNMHLTNGHDKVIINAYDGFRHINSDGYYSNLYSGGLDIRDETYSTNIYTGQIGMHNSGVDGNIEITTDKDLTQEEQDDGYSPVNIYLTDGDNKATINAKTGFTYKAEDGYKAVLNSSGMRADVASDTGSIYARYAATNIEYHMNDDTYFKIGVDENVTDHSLHSYIALGPDSNFKLSRPDDTEGGIISGIKSLTAFANPSATKVWATDGSTVDLTTKANVADLATKANASDVLLKKSASGGYYIEENSNELGYGAFAANSECIASGDGSHAEGHGTASGGNSHAEGTGNASGDNSHAEGVGTANGDCSHAEGVSNANGFASHAEGYGTTNGDSSHAEGHGTASGDDSHAEGYGTASGDSSHAEGNTTKAQGNYSHAEGQNTIASGYCSHAQGCYNVENINAIHSVGIGNRVTRKNAEYIYAKNNKYGSVLVDDPKNGYKYLIGVGGYDGISTDNTTYKSVQEVIADLTARIEQLEKLTANCVSISNVDEQTN